MGKGNWTDIEVGDLKADRQVLYELTVNVENSLDSLLRVLSVIKRRGMAIKSITMTYTTDSKSAKILIQANEQQIKKDCIIHELYRLIDVKSIDVNDYVQECSVLEEREPNNYTF